ncbi:hypothetical protein BAZOLSSOX_2793 [uncultured Gammaproteobacteria bacterium]|nr:hypothetical protein BAZOLSSOX_2793 [uncultured Gammaproteobacteria bacterium]
MNSIKTIKGLLSQDFTTKAFDEKESDYWSDSQKDSNFKIKQTKAFDEKESDYWSDSQDEKESDYWSDSFSLVHLKDNGYSVTEGSKL